MKSKRGSGRRSDDSVKSLAKMVSILDAFSTSRRSMSLAEISAATGLPRSTAHRLAASLRDAGLLDQEGHRDRYRLGIKLFEYGNTALANLDLHREARPFVDALSRISGHLVNLAVFDGREAVVVHRVLAEGGTPLTLIEAAPIHCTSTGKAILAFQPVAKIDAIIADGLKRFTDTTITDGRKLKTELKLIRARGYAVDEGEHQPGIRCVGAPIRDRAGRVIAGMSVSGPARQLKKDQVGELAKILVHHSELVTAKL
ncbi:IclR family transcriptional regulator [Reyranella sp.]|uniref:IclR family transcriptional regulator n=1 Tax=Reyranella sp. TaxID=1929291 RepID=UPI0037847AA0